MVISAWQPIETAPKVDKAAWDRHMSTPIDQMTEWLDLPTILLWFNGEFHNSTPPAFLGYWDWDAEDWLDALSGDSCAEYFDSEPTHWAPLPAPLPEEPQEWP